MPRATARVVVGDRLATFLADVEPFAGERELARLGLDPAFADLLLAEVQGERALGRHPVALLAEDSRQDGVADRERPVDSTNCSNSPTQL